MGLAPPPRVAAEPSGEGRYRYPLRARRWGRHAVGPAVVTASAAAGLLRWGPVELAPLVPRALAAPKVVFLTDEDNTPAAVAAALLAAGAADRPAHVFEHLGGAAER